MLHAIETETSIEALIDLALDQTLARDIRHAAGDRLNDLPAALAHVASLQDISLLGKIARTGTMNSKLTSCAKGRIIHLGVNAVDSTIERMIQLWEEQNELLRRMLLVQRWPSAFHISS
jgi:hypothetical protein